ncbi:MAG: hypothetical protein BRC28_02435 [Nanohaloarchaea archaeon SW_4_43_9]|nr:MAG: hypothetical protein BRC28_02435 [Nanohaloarchaea archaeon SW_4_43_9]
MSKVAVNVADEEKSLIDKFVEKIPGYKNRSDFIRKAVRNEMKRDYEVLEEISGSWTEKEAEETEKRMRELKEEDIEASKHDN